MNRQPSRRDFLSGSAILRPIRDRASSVAPKNYVHFSRRAMACDFSVFFPADAGAMVAADRARAAIDALDLVEELEAQLTIYRDDSEIALINRDAVVEEVTVEKRLFGLLERSVELHKMTDGAFDITAGPLARAWGFTLRSPAKPSDESLRHALSIVGSRYLVLDRKYDSARLTTEGVEINLGAIGKGYALDRCSELLKSRNEETFLIHGGKSSVLARTVRKDAPWKIDLRLPFGEQERLATVFLSDHAIATSGDAVQRLEIDGKAYGHIIDPRSGWPADKLVTATAFAKTAADADALATAFFIMGAEQTAAFCDRHPEFGALLVRENDNGAAEVLQLGSLPKVELED